VEEQKSVEEGPQGRYESARSAMVWGKVNHYKNANQ